MIVSSELRQGGFYVHQQEQKEYNMLNLKDFQGYRAPKLGKRDHSLMNGGGNPRPWNFNVFFQPPYEKNY